MVNDYGETVDLVVVPKEMRRIVFGQPIDALWQGTMGARRPRRKWLPLLLVRDDKGYD